MTKRSTRELCDYEENGAFIPGFALTAGAVGAVAGWYFGRTFGNRPWPWAIGLGIANILVGAIVAISIEGNES